MDQPLVISALAFFAGAGVKFFFDWITASSGHVRQLRSQAYLDFVSSVAKLSAAAKQNTKAPDTLSGLADAKTRICMYGSKRVVKALAEFEQSDRILVAPETLKAFLKIVGLMRADNVGSFDANLDESLQAVLFGKN